MFRDCHDSPLVDGRPARLAGSSCCMFCGLAMLRIDVTGCYNSVLDSPS